MLEMWALCLLVSGSEPQALVAFLHSIMEGSSLVGAGLQADLRPRRENLAEVALQIEVPSGSLDIPAQSQLNDKASGHSVFLERSC